MHYTAPPTTQPSEAEAVLAKETRRALASRLRKGRPVQVRIVGDSSRETLTLPAPPWVVSFVGWKTWPWEMR